MPDIKTALEKALSQTQAHIAQPIPADWDDEGGAATIETVTTQQGAQTVNRPYFSTTNNVTRITFDYVLKNPGKTRKEIIKALEDMGFKQGSTSSLLGQFTKQGHFVDRGGFFFATKQEYVPLKARLRSEKKAAPAKKATREIAPSAPVHKPLPENVRFVATTKQLLDTLSVSQARELYDELRKIFGG